jgi:TIR domain/Effector-associated domain 11
MAGLKRFGAQFACEVRQFNLPLYPFPLNAGCFGMKEQVQQLIAAGHLEKALELLAQFSPDVILLLSQINSGKKNFNLGLIDFSEWNRLQNRVSFAALELSSKYQSDFSAQPSSSVDVESDQSIAPIDVFISYHEADQAAAVKVLKHLEESGFHVTTAKEAINAGQNIREFIEKQMRKQGFVLSLVSKESLMSGWMGVETELAFYAGLFDTRQFIPIALDYSFKEMSFIYETVEEIDGRLEDIYEEKQRRKDKRIISNDLNDEEERLSHLRNFLPLMVQRLKSHQLTDLTDLDGEKFEEGMRKIIKTMTSWRTNTNSIIQNSKNIIIGSTLNIGGDLKIGDLNTGK